MTFKRLTRVVCLITSVLIVLFIALAVAIVWDGVTDDLARSDVAVVLGNAVEAGKPSPRLQARLDRTVELYKRGLFARVIVSGGIDRDWHDEAEVMARYLVGQGVPAESIYVDSEGANTYLTAQNASRLMKAEGMESAMVITQYFHISRSRLAMERFGVKRVYTAHATHFEWRDVYSTAREVVALCVYLVRPYP